jgi:uncharacterized protein (DUF302 family)
MLFQESTQTSLDEIDHGLRESAARHNFGVIAVHDLKGAMEKKGGSFANTCLVYEVCNPVQAKNVLEANGAFSTVLPCRISVYGSENNYKIATVLPTTLVKMFQGQGLEPVAKEVE